MAEILSLAEYKTVRGITNTSNDTQLAAIIEMVNNYIENYCNREFGNGVFSERNQGIFDYLGRYVFHVKNKPISTVSSVSIRFFGVPTPLNLDPTKLDIFGKEGYCYYSSYVDPGLVVIREEYKNNFYYDITYSGGQAVPKAVQLAAITAVGDTFNYFQKTTISGTQTTGELTSVKIGDYSESYETSRENSFSQMHDTKTGLVLTKTVTDLLNPFKIAGQSW